ncbi:MAG TPA: SPFH domain-containing protein [Streptosporangiaceae bacterium]|jgi:regulator of protease activity HflC (stomatin/prohibitin superfamily)
MSIDTAVTGATASRPSDPEISERAAATVPGRLALAVITVAVIAGVWLVSDGVGKPATALVAVGAVLLVLAIAVARGLVPVAPGEARVVQLFGRYAGTIRADGLRWIHPVARTLKVSTRIRNHETAVAKVNDADGNPIEIAAVVVWQVEDTARAVFGVDNFIEFVAVQAETAVRQVATGYPYDEHGDGRLSLRDSTGEVTTVLAAEITQRVEPAGVRIIESRFTRLAYAPEIAHAMLRRQQAVAVVAARQKIVDGAVGMVESALARLEADDLVELDAERKAAMVSNMLVVLCSDHPTQPVVNTGTLYQ